LLLEHAVLFHGVHERIPATPLARDASENTCARHQSIILEGGELKPLRGKAGRAAAGSRLPNFSAQSRNRGADQNQTVKKSCVSVETGRLNAQRNLFMPFSSKRAGRFSGVASAARHLKRGEKIRIAGLGILQVRKRALMSQAKGRFGSTSCRVNGADEQAYARCPEAL
jgi:hypothetical protein